MTAWVPGPGDPVCLVRWVLTPDGWRADRVDGQYWGRAHGLVRVQVGDRLRVFPVEEWEVSIP